MSIRYRNVVLSGRHEGAGSSTVANEIVGDDSFVVHVATHPGRVGACICHGLYEVSFNYGGNLYSIVDTVGLVDPSIEKDTFADFKTFFRHIFPDHINTILFVCSKGHVTAEEQNLLETFIGIFRTDLSPLAVMHCEKAEGNTWKSQCRLAKLLPLWAKA